jgi:electron transfer flavoprotein beta subunit
MIITVLIAGVHDPKWPVSPDSATDSPADYRIMSPFDEAALEIALRVRDARPGTVICVRVAGGGASAKIARAAAALNIADVATLANDRPWDQAAMARALASLCEGADLVLIGREFGDCDDGLVPPLLAGVLGLPFFGRAQTVEVGDAIHLMREAERETETLTLFAPLVVSVTNDRRTRLRKPLMKNVMFARQMDIPAIAAYPATSSAASLGAWHPGAAQRAATDCTMVGGGVHKQAAALAELLWESRA